MSLKLLIFDFDGTLVHTAPDIHSAINEYLIAKNQKPLAYEEVLPEIGMGLGALFQNTFPETEIDSNGYNEMVDEFIRLYESHYLRSPSLFPGALELLQSWPGDVAILSNKRERHIHTILKHLELHTFPWLDIIGGDTLPEKKPHPLPFEHLLKKAGCSPKEALMVGDGEPDIIGGVQAKIPTVAVQFGYGDIEKLQNLGAWKTVASFHELSLLAESLRRP
jgi:phosphoglycolate phosphatase